MSKAKKGSLKNRNYLKVSYLYAHCGKPYEMLFSRSNRGRSPSSPTLRFACHEGISTMTINVNGLTSTSLWQIHTNVLGSYPENATKHDDWHLME